MSAEERVHFLTSGYPASIRLPLIVRGEVIGLVGLFDGHPREFPGVALLQGLAQIAAQAMANARLFRQLDESSNRLAVVNETSLQLSSTLELRDILLSTAERLCGIGSGADLRHLPALRGRPALRGERQGRQDRRGLGGHAAPPRRLGRGEARRLQPRDPAALITRRPAARRPRHHGVAAVRVRIRAHRATDREGSGDRAG